MFDKNLFKEKFRAWSEKYPFATTQEIEHFCHLHMPVNDRKQYSWLVEQSIGWFMWRRESLQKELLQESNDEFMN